jgi:importin-5
MISPVFVQGLQDPSAKVRWAACQALGQMCTDLGPDIQTAKHQLIIPGLMSVMADFNQPRVQAHASAAIVNFSENCDQVCLCGKHGLPGVGWVEQIKEAAL